MDTQTLPLVPFGKYKGQPITTLMNDAKYLEWCKQQEWFQKFPIVYNICVNQTITTNNSNSKTPEHNKLQNLFLNNENVEKLLKIIFKTSKNIQIISGDIKFEGMFNWDLIVSDYQWCLCECDWTDENRSGCDCEINKKFRERYKIPEGAVCGDLKFDELYCEIKPLMGDDYPCVLRKLNTQIELTKNYATKQNEESDKYMKEEMRRYYKTNEEYTYDRSQRHITPIYVLLIKDFNSTTTTKEQLITIFNQSRIKIIFIDELFNNLPSQIIREQVEQIQDITIHTTPQQETEEENKLLREKLLHAEEKIKQLEEEIQSLKTKKQSKSIKDYFGKK
jgi:uncharacterized protein (DUF3820 family)